jgi:hypothetical protein
VVIIERAREEGESGTGGTVKQGGEAPVPRPLLTSSSGTPSEESPATRAVDAGATARGWLIKGFLVAAAVMMLLMLVSYVARVNAKAPG